MEGTNAYGVGGSVECRSRMQGHGGRAGWTPAGAVPRRRAESDETRSRSDVVSRSVAGLVDSSRRRQALSIMQDRFSSATRMDARGAEV